MPDGGLVISAFQVSLSLGRRRAPDRAWSLPRRRRTLLGRTGFAARQPLFVASTIIYDFDEHGLVRLPKGLVRLPQITRGIVGQDVHRPPPARLEACSALPPHF